MLTTFRVILLPNILLYLFVIVLSYNVLEDDDVSFVTDYFKYRNVREVLIIACSFEDTMRIFKLLIFNNIWAYIVDETQATSAMNDIMRQTYYKYGVFLDYNCPLGEYVLQTNSERYFLNTSYHWLVWGPNEKMHQVINTLNLSVDSEFVWSHKDSSTGMILLHDIYKINYTWTPIITPAGLWNSSEGLKYSITMYKYRRRGNLQGLVFRGGLAISNIPHTYLETELMNPENRKKDLAATFSYGIYKFLMQNFNFSVQLFPTEQFGYVDENGRYEGLVKMIDEGQVDVHVSALLINHARYRHMDFTGYSWKFRIGCIFRHPPVTGGYSALIDPFSSKLWTVAGVGWICVIIILRIVSYVQYHVSDSYGFTDGERHETTWSDAFLDLIGCVGAQSVTEMDAKFIPMRMVMYVMLLNTLLIDIYYASSIVFSLITERKQTIKNTRDLIETDLNVGAEDISYTIPIFEMNQDPLVRELYMKKMSVGGTRPKYYTVEEGAKKVLQENFAFHTELIKIYPIIEETYPDDKKCALAEITVFAPEMSYMAVKWKSAYKELLTFGLRKIAECGLLNYQNIVWRPKMPECSQQGYGVVPVQLKTIAPALGLVLIGLVSSIIILHLERYRFRREYHKQSTCTISMPFMRPVLSVFMREIQKFLQKLKYLIVKR